MILLSSIRSGQASYSRAAAAKGRGDKDYAADLRAVQEDERIGGVIDQKDPLGVGQASAMVARYSRATAASSQLLWLTNCWSACLGSATVASSPGGYPPDSRLVGQATGLARLSTDACHDAARVLRSSC